MSAERQITDTDFEIGFREPGRRTGLILLWLIFIGGSIWLYVVVPHDPETILLTAGFTAVVVAILTWRTYRTLRPRFARIDNLGITIRFPEGTSRIHWHEIESIELETYREPPSSLGRYFLRLGLRQEVQGQAIKLNLRRAYGLWRWMKVPFVALPFSKTVHVPVVDAPHFVAIATQHLASRR